MLDLVIQIKNTFESTSETAGQSAISRVALDLNFETPAKLGYVIPRLGLSKHRNRTELQSEKSKHKNTEQMRWSWVANRPTQEPWCSQGTTVIT